MKLVIEFLWLRRQTLLASASLMLLLQNGVSAQVSVQLPTIERFGVSTTVVVPDGGSVALGGVNSGYYSGTQFGVPLGGPGTRGVGRGRSTAGVGVSATIIDHNEIDRALLAEAARRRGSTHDILGRPIQRSSRVSPTSVGSYHNTIMTTRGSYLPKKLRSNIRGATPAYGMSQPSRYRYSRY